MPAVLARKRGGGERGRAAGAGGVALALLVALPRSGAADSLPNNRYALDLFQGPILAPLRVTGIAGAYAGYAEGIPGMVANAAAVAVREPYSANWFEPDISGSLSIPLHLFEENNDFDNSGTLDEDYSSFIYATLGGRLQMGPIGVGLNAELQRYEVDFGGGENIVTLGKHHLLAGAQLLGGQLAVGAGIRAVTLGINADTSDTTLTLIGVAPQIGFLVRPDWASWRLGATVRFPVDGGEFLLGDDATVDPRGVRRVGGLVLPDHVVLPWELELGVAIQVGPRPLNPAWIDPHEEEREAREERARRRQEREARRAVQLRAAVDDEERRALEERHRREREREAANEQNNSERANDTLERDRRARYQNWPREQLLITAEILVTGAVQRGVSMEWFLRGDMPDEPSKVGSSGAIVSFSPRFGIETEPIPERVQTRLGSYYEPSRFQRVGRQHFTFGADVKAFTTTFWGLTHEVTYKIQGGVDLAPRYESVSVGLGVWH